MILLVDLYQTLNIFRNHYGGDLKTIRGSSIGKIDFIPRSMKVIAC